MNFEDHFRCCASVVREEFVSMVEGRAMIPRVN
jgi:hypothetical protein